MSKYDNKQSAIDFLSEYVKKNNINHVNLFFDILNHFIRSFVISYGLMQDKNGREISGLYISIKSFFSIIKTLTYDINISDKTVFACIEQGRSIKFKELMSEYKQNRPQVSNKTLEDIERNEAFKYNITEFENFLQYLTDVVFLYHVNNIEGDFLLAYIFYKNYDPNALNIIVSTDKDFYQLISNKNTMIYNPLINKLITIDNFNENLKIKNDKINVHHISLLKSLMGDKSDNIVGITGVSNSVKMLNIITNNGQIEDIDANKFLELTNEYVKSNKHLKVFDKLLENQEHFKLSYKIMNLEQDNVLNMLSPENVLDINKIINNYRNAKFDIADNINHISKIFEEHNFDYELLIMIKKYIFNIQNMNNKFGLDWNHNSKNKI